MSQSTESTNETNPFTKPGYIIAAALVVALIAATIVIFLVIPDGSEEGTPQPAPSSTSTAVATSTAAATGKSICGLPTSTDKALGSAPKTNWDLVGKMATPTDPEVHGPGRTDDDGFRSCFAQTPTGALYAAANLIAMGSSADRAVNIKLTDKMLLPGPGRDAAMEDSRSRPATEAPSATTVQFRGFIIKNYSPTSANVDLAFQTNKGLYGHAVLPLKWSDGDWKAEIADSGELINDIVQISDLSGFIPWSGA
ncbi:hypothetical protein ASF72_01630 [Arthrobacter sp. Leaf141]|uniref:hypothetical protein n=1 Tax=Arthrobacter sp. Leaf141 TaxID=1736273 RepID=UPI0006F7B34E|nr:hypothetical protein [Arthrobacter sp. Leaf141]KQQ96387.1 hypothetical protein ASF72_01630 [Arthrobacter sp. Leaf141]